MIGNARYLRFIGASDQVQNDRRPAVQTALPTMTGCPDTPSSPRLFSPFRRSLSQPEWKHHTEWRRERGFDLEEIQPESLAFSVLGPWLSRLLDEHRADELVGRLLAVIDEFLTSDDPGARAAAAGLVEHWLFRLGGCVATAALLGPAITDLLGRLRAKWAP